MTWWILTQYLPETTFNSATINCYSNIADHAFMSWSYHKPARRQLFRRVRGKTIPCGFKYIWDTPNLAEQTQMGDTLFHRFRLVNLKPAATIWYYIWAPDGPYGNQIQGPLLHLTLPPAPYWPKKMYVATRARGVYYTRTFTGPEGTNPRWYQVNLGLDSLLCWQLAWSLLNPYARLYLIAGPAATRVLYRMEPDPIPWWRPIWPGWTFPWVPILTTEQACTLTGSVSGELCWVATDANHPGYTYVLFNSGLTDTGTWCLRSVDYGDSWTAHNIYAGIFNYRAGNIVAGLTQTAPPGPQANTLYASLNTGAGGHAQIYFSDDLGASWSLQDSIGLTIQVPRCTVDPTNLKTVYMTAFIDAGNPYELFRSQTQGANLVEIDGANHLGFFIDLHPGQMWINPNDRADIRVLTDNNYWRTDDTWSTWRAPTPVAVESSRLSIIGHSPDYLYLARDTSAPDPPNPPSQHVLFVSVDGGTTMWAKCGAHADEPDGGGDSIPYNCGGLALDGICHPEPEAYLWYD